MAVTFDAVSQGSVSGSTSLTISHTVGSGSDRALYVFVDVSNSTDLMSTGTVTYGGTSLTAVGSVETGNGSNFLRAFRLVAPASGTANVVITPSASAFLHAYCVSLAGVDQTTPEGTVVTSPASGSNTTSASPISTTVTLGTDGMALDMITRRIASSSLTPDASQTRNGTELTAGSIATSGSSRKAGSGSTTMTWTHASTNNVSHVVVPVNASVSSASSCDVAITGASGTLSIAASSAPLASLAATGGSGALSVAASTVASITSEPLKDNAGNLLASAPLDFVAIYNDTTGALVLRVTGISTNAEGRFVVGDATLTAGTTYRVDWQTTAGQRRMPRKAAA